MTRRLTLIRHAKSSWSDHYADDHGRGLSDRGITSAKALGAWIAQKGYIPDLILCSDAMRTVQTTTLLLEGMEAEVDVKEISTLYLAAPQTIIDITAATQGSNVALVGHNPGIGMAADMLLSAPPEHGRFADYPTGATTVIDFPDDQWCKPNTGTATAFAVPREI